MGLVRKKEKNTYGFWFWRRSSERTNGSNSSQWFQHIFFFWLSSLLKKTKTETLLYFHPFEKLNGINVCKGCLLIAVQTNVVYRLSLKNNCSWESEKFVFAASAMSPGLTQSKVSWCRRRVCGRLVLFNPFPLLDLQIDLSRESLTAAFSFCHSIDSWSQESQLSFEVSFSTF